MVRIATGVRTRPVPSVLGLEKPAKDSLGSATQTFTLTVK